MQKKYIRSLKKKSSKHRFTILLLIFDYAEHTCNSRLTKICVITFCAKKVMTFCVGKLLQFALIFLSHFALILLHFVLVLHFAAIITFCGVTCPTLKFSPLVSLTVINLVEHCVSFATGLHITII